ncbi:hypothetical protein Pelo_10331 [Pelomyxa schiedti]|nr:hypothetical protein Pelo_10331 [Pelomyxa schiedti]
MVDRSGQWDTHMVVESSDLEMLADVSSIVVGAPVPTHERGCGAVPLSFECAGSTFWHGFFYLDGEQVETPGCSAAVSSPGILVDVDMDGTLDLVFADESEGGLSIDLVGFLSVEYTDPTSFTLCSLTRKGQLIDRPLDVNGDNYTDFFVLNDGLLYCIFQTPDNCTEHRVGSSLVISVMDVGYLRADSTDQEFPSLLVLSEGKLSLLLSSDGGDSWNMQVLIPVEPTIAEITDYDGDGYNDIVTSTENTLFFYSLSSSNFTWDVTGRVETVDGTTLLYSAGVFSDTLGNDLVRVGTDREVVGLWPAYSLSVLRTDNPSYSNFLFSTGGEIFGAYHEFLSSSVKEDVVFIVSGSCDAVSYLCPSGAFELVWLENAKDTFSIPAQMATFSVIGFIIGLTPICVFFVALMLDSSKFQGEVLVPHRGERTNAENTASVVESATTWVPSWNRTLHLAFHGVFFIIPPICSMISCVMPYMYMLMLPLVGGLYILGVIPLTAVILWRDHHTQPSGCCSSGPGSITLRCALSAWLFCSTAGYVAMYCFDNGVLCPEDDSNNSNCDTGANVALAMLVIILVSVVGWMGLLFYEVHVIRTSPQLFNYGRTIAPKTPEQLVIEREEKAEKEQHRLLRKAQMKKVDQRQLWIVGSCIAVLILAILCNAIGGAGEWLLLGGYVVITFGAIPLGLLPFMLFVRNLFLLHIMHALSLTSSILLLLGSLGVNSFYLIFPLYVSDMGTGNVATWAVGFGSSVSVAGFLIAYHSYHISKIRAWRKEAQVLSTTPEVQST